MSDFRLVGNKIILRDWALDDLTIYEKWLQAGAKWQEQYEPYIKYDTTKIKDKISQSEQIISNNNNPFIRDDVVISLKDNNKFIGHVVSYWRSKETNWLRIGLVIYDDNEWGKGIGFESLKLWINYLFDTYKDVVHIGITTWSGHTGMIELAKKLGFKLDACHKKVRILNGKYYDSVGYRILREEWKEIFNIPKLAEDQNFQNNFEFEIKVEEKVKEEIEKIVTKLKDEKVAIEIIAKSTGLSIKEIEEILIQKEKIKDN